MRVHQSLYTECFRRKASKVPPLSQKSNNPGVKNMSCFTITGHRSANTCKHSAPRHSTSNRPRSRTYRGRATSSPTCTHTACSRHKRPSTKHVNSKPWHRSIKLHVVYTAPLYAGPSSTSPVPVCCYWATPSSSGLLINTGTTMAQSPLYAHRQQRQYLYDGIAESSIRGTSLTSSTPSLCQQPVQYGAQIPLCKQTCDTPVRRAYTWVRATCPAQDVK